MKKIFIMVLTFTILLSTLSIKAESTSTNNITFDDIKNHWAKDEIEKLVSMGVINGYDDGSFKPNNTITCAEFTKIMIKALHNDPGNAVGGHWADLYMKKAFDEKYANESDFDDYNLNITRGEIARMLSRALEYDADIENIENLITDYNDIPSDYQNHVARMYVSKIITGRSDGSFNYDHTATRAEAVSMLIRFLDFEVVEVEEVEPVIEEEPIVEIVEVDETFIEPEFYVKYFTAKYDFAYHGIHVENHLEYVGEKEHWFTTECISHPNLNTIIGKGFDFEYLTYTSDNIKMYKTSSTRFDVGSQIYQLPDTLTWKPSEGVFDLKDGDMMEYKITVSNNKTTKEYYMEFPFKDREFTRWD
ncbi:MAG: hypothetical protein CVV02_01675 [Firmicutes bacterium HGW-Firmicutes-7]|nr:MAG: hypothetical protein CVV02_01675 [Firmicutes bacterium HGW-Firmicutes-7]